MRLRDLIIRTLAGPKILASEVRKPFDREKEESLRAAPGLSKGLLAATAAFALWAVIEDLMTSMMAMSFYATLQPSDFSSYHKYTPILKITGASAFMAAVHIRGIRYWLIYAIPTLLIIAQIILLGLIHGQIHPADLDFFDFGPKWWRSA